MKKIDIFCSSQAATAICLSMDEKSATSTPSSSAVLLSGAAIDRHNPIIKDPKRIPKPPPPCSNHYDPPATPKSPPIHHRKKNAKFPLLKENDGEKLAGGRNGFHGRSVKNSWSCMNPGGFISPPGSTRYLLREKAVCDALSSDFDPDGERKANVEEIPKDVRKMEDILFEDKQSSPSLQAPQEEVVLRVSLHCRGCERKLRKHLSRMEGVTSYNIDFAAKKVTINGNITASGVLASISKVKNAQLWSPTLSS